MKNYLAIITSVGNSTANWFKHQVTYKGKVGKAVFIYPYGMHASAKADGKSSGILFPIDGNESNRFGIVSRQNSRPDLKEGEVCLYLPDTNTIVKLLADGSIEVVSDVAVKVTAPDVSVIGNVAVDGTIAGTGAFGVNGATAQTPFVLAAPATNLSTVIALANQLRLALIANGIGQ